MIPNDDTLPQAVSCFPAHEFWPINKNRGKPIAHFAFPLHSVLPSSCFMFSLVVVVNSPLILHFFPNQVGSPMILHYFSLFAFYFFLRLVLHGGVTE